MRVSSLPTTRRRLIAGAGASLLAAPAVLKTDPAAGGLSDGPSSSMIHPVWGDLRAMPQPPTFAGQAEVVTLHIDLATGKVSNPHNHTGFMVSGRQIRENVTDDNRLRWSFKNGRPLRVYFSNQMVMQQGETSGFHFIGWNGVHLIGFDAVAAATVDDVARGDISSVLNLQNLGYFDPSKYYDLSHTEHDMQPVYIEGAHIDLKYKSSSADLVRITGATSSINIVNSRLVGCGCNDNAANAAGGHPDIFHFQVGDGIRRLNGTRAVDVHNCVTAATYQLGIMRGEESRADFVWRRHTHYALDPTRGGVGSALRGWWMAYDQPGLGTMETAAFEDVQFVHRRFDGTRPTSNTVRYLILPASVWRNPDAQLPAPGRPLPVDDPRIRGAPIYTHDAPAIDYAPVARVGRHYVSPWS